ncbi:MAG: response regulator [Nonlabens sp.]
MITTPLKFLLIEDRLTDAALIQRQIEKCVENCEITITDNLLSFRHALKTFIPDFVFTDYDLVGFTGIDVINNLREIYPNTPVIVITGTLNNEELAASTIIKGADAFLLKKDINNLAKRLEPILNSILDSQKRLFAKLDREREERENINRIHAILKNAAQVKPGDQKSVDYYEKLLSEISENIQSVMK